MAIELPMASPSGRACEVTTKRRRSRIASTICCRFRSVAVGVTVPGVQTDVRTVFRGFRNGRLAPLVLFVEFAEDLLDAILVADGFVELEVELGYAPQPQAFAEMAPE